MMRSDIMMIRCDQTYIHTGMVTRRMNTAFASSPSAVGQSFYRLFIFGLGYVGRRVAQDVLQHPCLSLEHGGAPSWQVVGGTCSSVDKAKDMQRLLSIPVCQFDGHIGPMTDAKVNDDDNNSGNDDDFVCSG